jgi:uncharacterized membrane protein YqjE
MDAAPHGSAGFLGSLRSLADGLLGSVQDRLTLISIEVQEEKFRLIRTFVWISAIVFSGMMTMAFASLTVVYLFWETARLAVLGGLTALYAGAFVLILITFRRYVAHQPKPFAATLDEIGEDRACIQTES